MKYFVADPTAEMGIRQLPEERILLHSDGTLEYKHPDGRQVIVQSENWATDWDKTVMGAFNSLNLEIERLNASRQALVDASPKLQRLSKQLKLF